METDAGVQLNSEATKSLDNVATKVHHIVMPSIAEVQDRMHQRLEHECLSLQSMRKEMEELSRAYNRYIDLKNEVEARSKRIQRLVGVLGDEFLDEMAANRSQAVIEETNLQGNPSDLRIELRLWLAIREYLRVAGEAKVGDIQDFFEAMNFETVSRQAIESALRSHNKIFRVVKRGRDKYVSLKKENG